MLCLECDVWFLHVEAGLSNQHEGRQQNCARQQNSVVVESGRAH